MSIGDFDITVWSVLDLVIVTYLVFVIYKLLRGTAAFNIFVGVLLLYLVYWLVDILDMTLLSLVLGKFVGYGFLMLIIIFQPEVRSFLVMLGNTTLKGRGKFIEQIFGTELETHSKKTISLVKAVSDAMIAMSKEKIGALIVLSNNQNVRFFDSSGTRIGAIISEQLIRSIFEKSAPLHDGAMIISEDKIYSASVILPVTKNTSISKDLGLRHRAAIGVTETANVVAFIVSEETGEISFASKGKLYRNIDPTVMQSYLNKHINK